MLFKTLVISVIISFCTTFYFAQSYKSLKKGNWSAHLVLNETTNLPFKLNISGSKKKPIFTILNAEEKIQLTSFKEINDSLQIDFPNFHSYIRFVVKNKTEIAGTWTNLNKGNNYKIPFFAKHNLPNTVCVQQHNLDLTGRWKTTFSPNTDDAEMAIGVFKSADYSHELTGTFLTETGDYRFLVGQACSDKMFLSCFDGSHAFFFEANYKDGNLNGTFYSGKHYSTPFTATKDEKFELRNPDSLTYVVKKEPFAFKLKDLDGKEFVFPNEQFKNKVTVIQIMGTWCPNCLDESKFLKEMYQKYHQDGFEVISVGYETPTNFDEQVQKIKLLKSRLNLDFTFLVGGQANKALASEQFSMLNQIISFPTAIFLDKNGQIVKIHTGFNGPGTGKIYDEFKLETEELIKNLVK
ncbi:MAG: TlpA family protein disulfide reductase [Flavobacteriia bacterium]|jgi:thiol-disulfide isomerase/thioredoxin